MPYSFKTSAYGLGLLPLLTEIPDFGGQRREGEALPTACATGVKGSITGWRGAQACRAHGPVIDGCVSNHSPLDARLTRWWRTLTKARGYASHNRWYRNLRMN